MTGFLRALLTLPDDAFFELFRNYLGPVKTPFNKHDLIAQLQRLLTKKTTQERIVQMIDSDDAQLLSAIWLLGEPSYDQLFDFFAGELSYLDLHQRLLNVEDRLLVYRDEDRIRVNEILRPILEARILRAGWLFQARPRRASDPEPDLPWLSDMLLVSVYSFVSGRPEVFRADGVLRKRSLGELKARIPLLAEKLDRGSGRKADVLFQALLRMGALRNTGGRISADHGYWESFATTTPLGRLTHLVAGWAADEEPVTPSLIQALETVIQSLPADAAISPQSVERVLLTLADDTTMEVCRRVREGMALFGLLGEAEDGYLVSGDLPSSDGQTKPLIIQPNFDVTVPQELPFGDALYIARVASIVRHDRYSHYEITKDQFATALELGASLEEIVGRVREMAGGVLPANVVVSLQTWTHEFESIRLYQGVVLTVTKDRRHMIDHDQEIQGIVQRELAPGVYLLDRADVPALRSALESAGVEMIPELDAPDSAGSRRVLPTNTAVTPARRAMIDTFSQVLSDPGSLMPPELKTRDEWKEELHAALESTGVTPEQREELAARINRKLILSPGQLSSGSLRTEKTEARGLDYAGKVKIIEQAIRTGSSYLEIIERTNEGAPRRRLVAPVELNKKGNDLLLVADELPERTEVHLMVRKLGLVRRIRAGLVKRRPSP